MSISILRGSTEQFQWGEEVNLQERKEFKRKPRTISNKYGRFVQCRDRKKLGTSEKKRTTAEPSLTKLANEEGAGVVVAAAAAPKRLGAMMDGLGLFSVFSRPPLGGLRTANGLLLATANFGLANIDPAVRHTHTHTEKNKHTHAHATKTRLLSQLNEYAMRVRLITVKPGLEMRRNLPRLPTRVDHCFGSDSAVFAKHREWREDW